MTKKEMNKEQIEEEKRATTALITKTSKLLADLKDYQKYLETQIAKL